MKIKLKIIWLFICGIVTGMLSLFFLAAKEISQSLYNKFDLKFMKNTDNLEFLTNKHYPSWKKNK